MILRLVPWAFHSWAVPQESAEHCLETCKDPWPELGVCPWPLGSQGLQMSSAEMRPRVQVLCAAVQGHIPTCLAECDFV